MKKYIELSSRFFLTLNPGKIEFIYSDFSISKTTMKLNSQTILHNHIEKYVLGSLYINILDMSLYS